MKFDYFICLLQNVQMRKYLNSDSPSALKMTFLFNSGKCISKLKSKPIVISEKRTVLFLQIFSCPVWTYLYLCLFSDLKRQHLPLFLFLQLKEEQEIDTGSCKYLPALQKTTGYRYYDNIFKFTNKEDWTKVWKGI